MLIMVLRVVYKNKQRSYCQMQLDDYLPFSLDFLHQFHLDMIEFRYQRKKEWYQQLPAWRKKAMPPLRRGRKARDYPTRKVYDMTVPSQVGEVKQFKWFTRIWHQNRVKPLSPVPANQLTLERWMPATANQVDPIRHVVVPRFRSVPVLGQDDFCEDITNLGWLALRQYRDSPACLFYIFYMNDFSVLDDDALLSSEKWKQIGSYLASDIVKYELARLLLGFVTYTDYLRMAELFPAFEDQLAIAMARHPPAANRLARGLQLVGIARVRALHETLKNECRELGLIKDKVWLWDGHFYETWMKNQRKEGSRNKSELFGGWYNHGGKKRGFGIAQSVIADWSGYVPLPITVRVFPANENDNIMFRDTFDAALEENPRPALFIDTDKGPSGDKSIELSVKHGVVPVIALSDNRKQGVIKTSVKKYRFDAAATKGIDPAVLERVYMMRTRIEEMVAPINVLFRKSRLHGTGKDFLEIEVLLINIVIMLIGLTAFKIGRPNLAWKPSAFTNMKLHPRAVFPDRFKAIESLRSKIE
jgi:hypothetical protein